MRRRASSGGEKKRGSPTLAFTAGAEVEVRSDDEGFSGAWYEATVAVPPSSNHRRADVTVVYSSLLSDGSPTRSLEEVVPLAHVRPRPPRDRTRGHFVLHQPVDAFHNDGWWAGVVVVVHPGRSGAPGKYTVCFPNTREVVEFAPEDVRGHLQWVRGEWVEPNDKEEVETYYGVGAPIEVTRDKENYGAAWFTGRVLKVIRKSIFLVEYESLKADDGQLMREIVDIQYIRPCPSRPARVDIFNLHDEVEAFYRDRWQRCVVSKVLSHSKYMVKSKYQPEEEMEFDLSQLRPRLDWNNSRWVRASPGKCRISHNPSRAKSEVGRRQKLQAGKRARSSISLSTSRNSGDQATDPQSITTSNGRMAERPTLGSIESNQVRKKLKKHKLLDDMRLLDCVRMQRCSNTAIRMDKISDAFKDFATESPSQTCEQRPFDKPTSHSHSVDRSALCSDVLINTALQTSDGKSKSNGLLVSLANGEKPFQLNEKGSKVQAQTPNKSNLLFDQEVNDHILTMERGSFGSFRRPRSSATHHRMKKLIFRVPHCHTTVSNDGRQDEVEVSVTEKKRGRSRKRSTKDKGDTVECMEMERYDGTSDPAVETTDGKKDVELSIVLADILHENDNHGSKEKTLECCLHFPDAEGDLPVNIITTTHQAGPCDLSYTTDPFPEHIDSSSDGYTLTENLHAAQMPYVMSSTLNTIVKNIPRLDEFRKAGTVAEIQACLSPANIDTAAIIHTEVRHCQSSPKEVISEKEIVLADPLANESNMRKVAFPFIKKSSLWQSIESMEVFAMMLQEPHFRQLEQFSEEFREGMAIGLMVTFANTVENISKLRIMDSDTSFLEMLKTLIPLEANGFDVQQMRLRIEGLLEIKRNKFQLEVDKTASKGKISDLKDEKNRLHAVVRSLDNDILELEQNLACFCEKRAMIIMQGKSNDSEIAKLERDVEEVEEAGLLAEQQFDTALNAPW